MQRARQTLTISITYLLTYLFYSLLVGQRGEDDKTTGSAVGWAERQIGTICSRDRRTQLGEEPIAGGNCRAQPTDRGGGVTDQPADQAKTEPWQTVGRGESVAWRRVTSAGEVPDRSAQLPGIRNKVRPVIALPKTTIIPCSHILPPHWHFPSVSSQGCIATSRFRLPKVVFLNVSHCHTDIRPRNQPAPWTTQPLAHASSISKLKHCSKSYSASCKFFYLSQGHCIVKMFTDDVKLLQRSGVCLSRV